MERSGSQLDSAVGAYSEVRDRIGRQGEKIEDMGAGSLLYTAWQVEDLAQKVTMYAAELAEVLREMAVSRAGEADDSDD